MLSARSELTPNATPVTLAMMAYRMKALRQALRSTSRGSPKNSAVGVPGTAKFGCKTGFALYQIDAQTWQWQLIENRDPAETTTQLVQNGVCPALYVSVIQPYCQAEYAGITQECRAASDRLDRVFPAGVDVNVGGRR